LSVEFEPPLPNGSIPLETAGLNGSNLSMSFPEGVATNESNDGLFSPLVGTHLQGNNSVNNRYEELFFL
jgi:hypothetical protein